MPGRSICYSLCGLSSLVFGSRPYCCIGTVKSKTTVRSHGWYDAFFYVKKYWKYGNHYDWNGPSEGGNQSSNLLQIFVCPITPLLYIVSYVRIVSFELLRRPDSCTDPSFNLVHLYEHVTFFFGKGPARLSVTDLLFSTRRESFNAFLSSLRQPFRLLARTQKTKKTHAHQQSRHSRSSSPETRLNTALCLFLHCKCIAHWTRI